MGTRRIGLFECCMPLFRTANVPILPDAEARGVALVFQSPTGGGNVLVAAIGLPDPQVLGGETYVAWIRNTPWPNESISLLSNRAVIIEPEFGRRFRFWSGEQLPVLKILL